MTDYTELIKALRCKRDDCEGCDLAFFDNDEGWMCQYAAKDDDAADAIVALGLDNEDYEHENRRLHGEIEALQAEVDALAHDIKRYVQINVELTTEIEALQDKVFELEEWLNDADIADDDNVRQIEKLTKRNAELHAELQKWVSAAEKAGEPKRGEIVRCGECRWWRKKDDSPYGYCYACRHGYYSEHWEIGIYRLYKADWFCADGEREVQE